MDRIEREVKLREVLEEDLPIFFDHQRNPEAGRMAAFGYRELDDKDAFYANWAKILTGENSLIRTILVDGQVAGNVLKFEFLGQTTVAYWIGKEFWGKGIGTRALALLLEDVPERPVYARAAKDNRGSVRVLEKCGFILESKETNFAAARGEETEEVIMRLD